MSVLSSTLDRFERMLVYLNKPVFLFKKPSKKYSRYELVNFSQPTTPRNNICSLARNRVNNILAQLDETYSIKPRIAIELEFTLRSNNGKPYKLTSVEFKALEALLKQKYPCLNRLDYDGKYDLEAVFDSENSNPINLIDDVDSFKKEFTKHIDALKETDTGLFDGQNLSICLNPYQPHISRFSSNTYGLHINLSLYKDGKNIFASDEALLKNVASNILDVQGASFTLASRKPGIERISKGKTSPKWLGIGKNLSSGGVPVITSYVTALGGFIPFAIINDVNSCNWGDLLAVPSFALLFCALITSKNPSIAIRKLEKNPLFKWIPSQRLIKSSNQSRLENRMPGADQSIALAVLSTLYPALVALETKNSTLSANRPFKQNPEELLSEVKNQGEELKKMYGEVLFFELYQNALKELLD